MPGVPPVPIPNTAVKPRAADGSRTLGPARVGCCQVYALIKLTLNRGFFWTAHAENPDYPECAASRCSLSKYLIKSLAPDPDVT